MNGYPCSEWSWSIAADNYLIRIFIISVLESNTRNRAIEHIPVSVGEEIYEEHKRVPTVYVTCEDTGVELDLLERLFPDGYHRGLVKIAGLRR